MNLVSIIGRLTADPESRTSKNGSTEYVTFGLAVNERYGGEERVAFVNVTCFAKTAELVKEHKHKGDQVAVVGRLTTSEGFKNLRVVADRVEYLARAGGNGEDRAERRPAKNARPAEDEAGTAIPF